MTEQSPSRPTSRGHGSTAVGSGAGQHSASRPAGYRFALRALAAATAAFLVVDAFVHLSDARLYSLPTSAVTEGTLFRAEAIIAIVVAVALLVRPRPAVWALAVVVAASAVGAVLLSTYVDVGALGPFADMYEPTWAVPGKAASAIAETAAAVLALAGLTLALRTQRRPVA